MKRTEPWGGKRMFKKILVASSVSAMAAMAISGSASAASTSGVADFHLTINNAKIVVADLLPDGIEIPGSDPALVGKTINIDGVIDAKGNVKIGKSGFDFPAISLGDALPIPGVNLDIVQTDAATGTLTSTGVSRMPLKLGVSLSADLGGGAGLSCLIKGLNFNFSTGNATVGPTTLLGSAWNKTTRAITLTGTSAIPNSSAISSADCPIVSLLAGAGISGKAVALKLGGTTTIGSKYLPAAKATISSSTLKFTKGSGKNIVKVTCAGSASKARACVGTVALTVGGTTGAPVSINVSPGKSVSYTIALTPGQVTAVGKKTLTGSLNAVIDRGTTTLTKSVKVSNK